MFQPHAPLHRPAESQAELVGQVKALCREVDLYQRKTQTVMLQAGERLLRLKEAYGPRGDWLAYLAETFPSLPPRTAQRWMDLARPKESSDTASEKNATVAHPPNTPQGATPDPAGTSGEAETVVDLPDVPVCPGPAPVWHPPERYAEVARSMVHDLRRVRRKLAAVLDGPCGDAAREYLRRHGKAGWAETGESEVDREVFGVDLVYRVYQCEAYLALVDDANGLSAWLKGEGAGGEHP